MIITVFGLGAPSFGSPTPLGRGAGGYCALLAAKKGWQVRGVCRDPAKYSECFKDAPLVSLVKGDALDRASVASHVAGADAAVFAIQAPDGVDSYQVDCNGLIMMGEECAKANCKLIVVSAKFTSPKRRFNIGRVLSNTLLKWNMMDAKWAGEQGIRRMPGLRYCIVRPGMLTNHASPNKMLAFSQFDDAAFFGLTMKSVTKEDVALVCVEAIANASSDRVSIDISGPATSNAPPLDMTGVFEKMIKDEVQ